MKKGVILDIAIYGLGILSLIAFIVSCLTNAVKSSNKEAAIIVSASFMVFFALTSALRAYVTSPITKQLNENYPSDANETRLPDDPPEINATESKKTKRSKIAIISSAVMLLVFFSVWGWIYNAVGANKLIAVNGRDNTISQEVYSETLDEDDSYAERDNSSAKRTTLYSGTFYAGQDIPIGRYEFMGNGNGNFVIYSSDDSLMVNEILTDEKNSDFGIPSVTLTIQDGDKIEISGLESVDCVPANTKISLSLSAGYWTVGLDINPGSYDASPKSGNNGNFIIYSNDGKLKTNEILGGDYGISKVHVNLENGDIINISGMTRVNFKKS